MRAGGQTDSKLERHSGWPAEVSSLVGRGPQIAAVLGGLRNDAIARRLFIAPGTVKVHLSHIFAKLGITTRAELAAQAAARTSGPNVCAEEPQPRSALSTTASGAADTSRSGSGSGCASSDHGQ